MKLEIGGDQSEKIINDKNTYGDVIDPLKQYVGFFEGERDHTDHDRCHHDEVIDVACDIAMT